MIKVTEADLKRCEAVLALIEDTELTVKGGTEAINLAQTMIWLRDLRDKITASVTASSNEEKSNIEKALLLLKEKENEKNPS